MLYAILFYFLKASNSHKGPYEFEKVEHVQEFKDEHEGAIWCMKFSACGRLLATAGQDKVLRIWIVKDAFPFFQVSSFCFKIVVYAVLINYRRVFSLVNIVRSKLKLNTIEVYDL